jgi:hypothetical protein
LVVDVAPIIPADVPAVARFMRANLNPRVSEAAWARALDVPWRVEAPNHGFLLRADDQVVGAYLAFYADRSIAGEIEPFCNLGAWCVLEDHRSHSVRLLKSLLGQKGYHFTDLSPSGNVIPLNRRLKFIDLDTTTSLVPNLPWVPRSHRCRVNSDPEVLTAELSGSDAEIYRDHRNAAAAKHVLLTSGSESCYVIYRLDTRKRVRSFVSILHVGDPTMFQHVAAGMGPYLLTHHGAAATLVEQHIVAGRPEQAIVLNRSRPKMYKSDSLGPDQIDYLYSELTCLSW